MKRGKLCRIYQSFDKKIKAIGFFIKRLPNLSKAPLKLSKL